MWPWEHLGIGYVAYLLVRPRAWWEADRITLGALVLGTQLPDLVDKPLAWVFAVLPSGRSFAHSLFFAAALAAVAVYAGRRYQRLDASFALVFGDLTHLALDAWEPYSLHQYRQLGFLFWPLTPSPYYDEPTNLMQLIRDAMNADFDLRFFATIAFASVLVGVFAYHVGWRAPRAGRARSEREERDAREEREER